MSELPILRTIMSELEMNENKNRIWQRKQKKLLTQKQRRKEKSQTILLH